MLHCFSPDAPDSDAPEIYRTVPKTGLALSGAPPIKMSATLYDTGSGVDLSTVTMQLDHQPVDAKIDYMASTISYKTDVGDPNKPVRSLPNGVHTITVTAKDYAGNIATKEWFFIADSSLPPPKRVKTEGKRTKAPGSKSADQNSKEYHDSQQNQAPEENSPPPPPPPMPAPEGQGGAPGGPPGS